MLCFGTVLHIRPRILDVVAHGSGENADRLADMTSGNSLQHKRVRKSPGERRQEILDAAVRLISERGYNGTSVQDVADVLGIGLAHAYEVAHRQDFPTITLAAGSLSPRDKFMAWIDEQSAKKNGNILVAISKDSVVFVCVAKGGMNNGKETSKRRGQHPQTL